MWLAELEEKLKKSFVFIPRIYTSKPRTDGLGYKGLLHRPDAMSGEDDLFAGVIAMRRYIANWPDCADTIELSKIDRSPLVGFFIPTGIFSPLAINLCSWFSTDL